MAWGLTTPRALGHPARLRWARRCRRTAASPAEAARAPPSWSAVATAGHRRPGPLDPVSIERWGFLGKVGGWVNAVCGGAVSFRPVLALVRSRSRRARAHQAAALAHGRREAPPVIGEGVGGWGVRCVLQQLGNSLPSPPPILPWAIFGRIPRAAMAARATAQAPALAAAAAAAASAALVVLGRHDRRASSPVKGEMGGSQGPWVCWMGGWWRLHGLGAAHEVGVLQAELDRAALQRRAVSDAAPRLSIMNIGV